MEQKIQRLVIIQIKQTHRDRERWRRERGAEREKGKGGKRGMGERGGERGKRGGVGGRERERKYHCKPSLFFPSPFH